MDILRTKKLKEKIEELEAELMKIKSIKKEKYIELTPDLAMCELDDVDEIPIFVDAVKAMKSHMKYWVAEQWKEKNGGFISCGGEFTTTTPRPRLFKRGYDKSPLKQYKQKFSETGWVTVFDCVIPENVIVGMGGIGFIPSNDFSRITELGFEIKDKRYSKINVEEGFNTYKKPVLLLNNPIVLTEASHFYLRIHLEDNLFKGEREMSIFPVRGLAFYRRVADIILE